jgi:hypothetical protein
VGDYEGELCQPLAAPIVEPNGLSFEPKIEDGFFDAKRRERLRLGSSTRRNMLFWIENPDWCVSEHWREEDTRRSCEVRKSANLHRLQMAAQSAGIVN